MNDLPKIATLHAITSRVELEMYASLLLQRLQALFAPPKGLTAKKVEFAAVDLEIVHEPVKAVISVVWKLMLTLVTLASSVSSVLQSESQRIMAVHIRHPPSTATPLPCTYKGLY